MKHTLLTALVMGACSLGAIPGANAHYLWIERSGSNATVYFGEYEEAARERSPGRLDEIPGPMARSGVGPAAKTLALQKHANGFAFPSLTSTPQPLLVEETAVGVKDWSASGIGVVKPYFYARNQSQQVIASEPATTLDILPMRERGLFRVYFQGQPLPKAAVKIVAPNTWAQEGRTDGEGLVRLPLPGQYIVQVIHLEPGNGEYEGKTYQAKRHRATLTFVADHGDAAVSSQPVAKR